MSTVSFAMICILLPAVIIVPSISTTFLTFLLKVSRLLFGDSLLSIRFGPVLMHITLIVITAVMTKEMGGKKFFAGFLPSAVFALSPISSGK